MGGNLINQCRLLTEYGGYDENDSSQGRDSPCQALSSANNQQGHLANIKQDDLFTPPLAYHHAYHHADHQ